MLPRFYCPELSSTTSDVVLPADISHHAINVLRLTKNDTLMLFDGRGNEAIARIVAANASQMHVSITQFAAVSRETPARVTLVQALPSGDKMDWIVEKCTELGVSAIQPVQATRSIVKLSEERAARRIKRWQDIAISACAQCGRNVVPQVLPVLSFNAWLIQRSRQPRHHDVRLLMDPSPEVMRLSQVDFSQHGQQPVTVLIGPEGAFTEEEIQYAKAGGFLLINLGARILRTETAGLAFMAAINALQGDF